jgi:predicted metal-dependent peptidase
MTAITITPVELTEAQKRKWIETRGGLLWKCPAFTHLLFSMLNPTNGEMAAIFTTAVPIAATDGSNLILNPEPFFALPLDERVFILAHEILHCVFNHCGVTLPMHRSKIVKFKDGKTLPYDAEQMNMAMDYVINDVLVQDKIGKFPSIGGCHDIKIATKDDNFLDTYRKIYDPQQQGKGGGGNGGKGSFDVLLPPGAGQGQTPEQTPQRSQAAWDTAVAAALAAAKVQGKLPANLDRLLSEIIDPTVPWQEHIRSLFARKVGAGGYDWRKPDRNLILRDIYAPRRSGHGCGTVVVGVDTSGSIGNKELAAFFGEMRGILDDVRPTRLVVIWCDAKVHKVDYIEDSNEVNTLKPHGGGGTDFRPVFDYIWEHDLNPDALVYLTDGMGSFPDKAPNYPVIWGNIYKGMKYPWGDVVDVDLK